MIYLQYIDDNGLRKMGLTVADRADVPLTGLIAKVDSIKKLPADAQGAAMKAVMENKGGEPLMAERVYVGRDRKKAALVNLSDRMGRSRIRMMVDSLGTPSLEFLDEAGKVTSRLPAQ
ncbi:MAG: hypothetical protein ABI647_24240 [Gemmatimonadota bacterium]